MPLKIHFLNVGHGDCTIVEFPSGRVMMVDINNSKSLPDDDIVALAEAQGVSTAVFRGEGLWLAKGTQTWEEYYKSLLVDPADYFKTIFPGKSIFRYVQTHPDMDHMSGLHRLFWQDKVVLENFWDVTHGKTHEEEDFDNSPYAWSDWAVYQLLRLGCGPTEGGAANNHKVLNLLRGDTGMYWLDDNIEVLSPTTDLVAECDKNDRYNNCSYVLKLTHAGRAVILPGDAEGAAWSSMLDELGADSLKCDVLKASHHGRESGYDNDAVSAMSPAVVICSVGKKPDTDASDEYASHGAEVLSTRYKGTITVTIEDDGRILVDDRKGERITTIN